MGFYGKSTGSSGTRVSPYANANALGIQTKLSLGKKDDPAEKEADKVARQVTEEQQQEHAAKAKEKKPEGRPDGEQAAMKKAGAEKEKQVQAKQADPEKEKVKTKEEPDKDKLSKKALQPATETEKEKPQGEQEKQLFKKEDNKEIKKQQEDSDKKPVEVEKEQGASPKRINRKPNEQNRQQVQQKPATGGPVPTPAGQKEQEGGDDETRLAAIEDRINTKRGTGNPLPQQAKAGMERSFGHDFSDVRVHHDEEAAKLCAALNAQAFAVGNDIFFNKGRYDPDSDKGKELLAHELTHVVQQTGHIQKRVLMRNPVTPANPGGASDKDGKIDNGQIVIPTLVVPAFKSRNTGKFGTSVTRKKKYSRKAATGSKGQTDIWKQDAGINAGVKTGIDNLKPKAGKKPSSPDVYFLKWKGIKLFGKEETLAETSKIPLWNASGEVSAFDVDHILELQLVGGENVIDNMELLNFSGNRSSGSQISNNIEQAVQNFIIKTGQNFSLDEALDTYEIRFEKVSFTGKTEKSSKGSGKDGYWSYDQIKSGKHLEPFTAMTEREMEAVAGKEDDPVVYTSPAGGAMLQNKSLKRLPGFEGNINLAKSGNIAGQLTGKFNPNDKIFEPLDNISINIYAMDGVDFGGYIKRRTRGGGNLETVLSNLKIKGLSPVEIDEADLLPDTGIVVRGRIKPSAELIKDLYIDFTIEGNTITLSRTFTAGDIQGIPPPLKVTEAGLTVFAQGGSGVAIGISGKILFEINKVGKGEIGASGNSNGVFKLNGNFDFDEKLFGGVKANVKASYEHADGADDKWNIEGDIKIPKGKIAGIDSAEIKVGYADRVFKADGSAKFAIPGLEDGKLTVTYGNEQLQIEGEANFKHRLIKTGQVKAKLETGGEQTKLSLSGNARPNIPGVDTELTVSYIDGAITISGSVAYTKGRLSGTLSLGVTNQAVGAEGKPAGGAGNDLVAFGSGSLTLRITSWLQGTAGVTLKPDGSIEVVGKIGIPQAVDIFPKKEIKKDVFKAPTIEIPLFAIPVGSRSIGLVATIGGGAEAYASIGPGQLTQAEVEVTYNPAQEENMSVTGSARFKVPAEAGLRLFVRAGIGLSVGIARVAGGVEIGGALGIEGAAEAGVQVNWTPTQGFKLDAEAALSVQPKFKFDVNAYVEAVLDLWVKEFRKEWKKNLYAFEWGPSMKFGVKFPVHYEEGKPFEISLDQVQFETPQINVSDIAKGIGKQVLG